MPYRSKKLQEPSSKWDRWSFVFDTGLRNSGYTIGLQEDCIQDYFLLCGVPCPGSNRGVKITPLEFDGQEHVRNTKQTADKLGWTGLLGMTLTSTWWGPSDRDTWLHSRVHSETLPGWMSTWTPRGADLWSRQLGPTCSSCTFVTMVLFTLSLWKVCWEPRSLGVMSGSLDFHSLAFPNFCLLSPWSS